MHEHLGDATVQPGRRQEARIQHRRRQQTRIQLGGAVPFVFLEEYGLVALPLGIYPARGNGIIGPSLYSPKNQLERLILPPPINCSTVLLFSTRNQLERLMLETLLHSLKNQFERLILQTLSVVQLHYCSPRGISLNACFYPPLSIVQLYYCFV